MKLVPGPQKLSIGGNEEPSGGDRPWHWSLIGVVAIFLAWLPLSWLAALASGFATALTAWVISVTMVGQFPSLGSLPSLVLACVGGTLSAALGGRLGLARRTRTRAAGAT